MCKTRRNEIRSVDKMEKSAHCKHVNQNERSGFGFGLRLPYCVLELGLVISPPEQKVLDEKSPYRLEKSP